MFSCRFCSPSVEVLFGLVNGGEFLPPATFRPLPPSRPPFSSSTFRWHCSQLHDATTRRNETDLHGKYAGGRDAAFERAPNFGSFEILQPSAVRSVGRAILTNTAITPCAERASVTRYFSQPRSVGRLFRSFPVARNTGISSYFARALSNSFSHSSSTAAYVRSCGFWRRSSSSSFLHGFVV